MNSPLIRVLTPDDASAYRALRLRGLREHPDAFTSSYEEDVQHPLAVTAARLATPRVTLWGGFVQGLLSGVVGLERETRAKNRHKATVVGMYVAPEAAGRGLGRALLAALLAQARAEPLQLLVLTVTQGNVQAQRLYEHCGFRSFGIEPKAIQVAGTFFAKNHMALDLGAPS